MTSIRKREEIYADYLTTLISALRTRGLLAHYSPSAFHTTSEELERTLEDAIKVLHSTLRYYYPIVAKLWLDVVQLPRGPRGFKAYLEQFDELIGDQW